MADNAIIKILTALLKHQVKKVVGDEALGEIGKELVSIGGDKVDEQIKSWLGEETNAEELENAARYAHKCFQDKVENDELVQWMVSLPLGDLPKVVEALEKVPKSPDEKELENALRESVATNWKKLSQEQVDQAINSFLACLRSALLPIEKQTLLVIGRSVLRIEEKITQLAQLVEQLKPYSIEAQTQSRFINIGGNVQNSVVISGDHNIVYYYAGGEKHEMRTGWFYGHRYGDLASFTGRAAEMQMLDEWLENDKENLLVLTAFGGFGKSALTWQWFNNRVDKTKWQTAIWWSFYEKESGFESFLAETLAHLGVEVKASARMQVNDLLEAMRGTNILIVLDGFERLLRQYGRMDAALQSDDEDAAIDPSQRDCSSPLTETFLRGLSGAGMKSKVLMTTRLCPRALESADGKLLKGCCEAPLAAFSPEDAVTYFHNEGIKATRAEILALCAAYSYHPLSLSLLVGLINADHERRGDIEAVKNLEIFADVKARRHHVLARAYGSLAPERRDLLSKMSCFRGSMEYTVLKKVFPSPDLDKSLLDLRKRGLLQYAGETQRYDMHPIVRHYAYDHFTDEKRRKEAHVQLAMHFIDAMPVTNRNVKTLEDLAPVIELYHHMVGAGNLDEARKLFRERLSPNPLYFQFGAYQLQIELLRALFLDGEDAPPRLKDETWQALTLNELANSYSLSGQPRRAVPLYEGYISISEKRNDKTNTAIGLGAVADVALIPIGALKAAERNLHRKIDLCVEIDKKLHESKGHLDLSRVLAYCGNWEKSEQEQGIAQQMFEKENHVQGQGIVWAYRALRFLLMARYSQPQIENLKTALSKAEASAIECAQRALELADEDARTDAPTPRDYVRAHWLLGAAYCANNELTLAEENLSKALSICRQVNLVEMEADILLELAKLRYAQEKPEEAKTLSDEALLITERSGYVLQGADVHLFLAHFALEQEKDKAKAKELAEKAKELATCDGPPYYYKVAYEEAESFLEELK